MRLVINLCPCINNAHGISLQTEKSGSIARKLKETEGNGNKRKNSEKFGSKRKETESGKTECCIFAVGKPVSRFQTI